MILEEINNKLYATARAHIVTGPEELPREMAFAMEKQLNKSFLWIAGRYVQAEEQNLNGHYWTADDLNVGQGSIRHTPLNVQHQWDRPVGTFVETKMVSRMAADTTTGSKLEIQALSVLWAGNFPALAERVRQAHKEGKLWYSMECVAEAKQCLSCDETFVWASAETCEHLRSSASAPRRFINPTFLGGALVFPPELPAWPDADITEVARLLTNDYANRTSQVFDVPAWKSLMEKVSSK